MVNRHIIVMLGVVCLYLLAGTPLYAEGPTWEEDTTDPCAGDVDGDGSVGFQDILALLNDWGPCDPAPNVGCPGDQNGDGSVGFNDLLIILNEWGTECPPPEDAGSSPGEAQTPSGSGSLDQINGDLDGTSLVGPGDFEDMYAVRVCDVESFLVSTGFAFGGYHDFNTQLFILKPETSGSDEVYGRVGNDDLPNDSSDNGSILLPYTEDGTGGIQEGGVYYIAISGHGNVPLYDEDPLFFFSNPQEISGPDGPGGEYPLNQWSSTTGEVGEYTIVLDGLAFPGEEVDCNGNGVVDQCDLYWGNSQDTNENGIPDECEDGSGGEECSLPIPVDVGKTPIDTTGATGGGEAGPDSNLCPGTYFTGCLNDVWYSYLAEEDGHVTISLCGSVDFDTDLAVWSAGDFDGDGTVDYCPSDGADLLACNGDALGCPNYSSEVSFDVTAGSRYGIQVGGYGGDTGMGAMTITLDAAPPPTPTGDTCDDALIATVGPNVFDTTDATTGSEPYWPAWCTDGGLGGLHQDIWFKFTPEESGTYILSTCDPLGFDTDLVVYGGSCDNLIQEACNGDASGGEGCQPWYSSLTVDWVAGFPYWIRIGGWSESEWGAGTISINPEPKDGDECINAIPADLGENLFDTTTYTNSPDGYDPNQCEGTSLGQMNQDIWFQFMPAESGTYFLNTCDEGSFDTDLVVYSGSCGNLNQLACNGDGTDGEGCQGYFSSLSVEMVAGHPYLIRVGGWSESEWGPGTIEIGPQPKDGDECSNAISADFGANPFDTTTYTNSPDGYDPNQCEGTSLGQMNQDIWFTFTPSVSDWHRISTCDVNSFDTDLVVYRGSCGDLVQMACSGDGENPECQAFFSELWINTIEGVPYQIRIGGWDESQAGSGTLWITSNEFPDPPDWPDWPDDPGCPIGCD